MSLEFLGTFLIKSIGYFVQSCFIFWQNTQSSKSKVQGCSTPLIANVLFGTRISGGKTYKLVLFHLVLISGIIRIPGTLAISHLPSAQRSLVRWRGFPFQPNKVKMQYMHCWLIVSYFLFPWRKSAEMSRLSIIFHN